MTGARINVYVLTEGANNIFSNDIGNEDIFLRLEELLPLEREGIRIFNPLSIVSKVLEPNKEYICLDDNSLAFMESDMEVVIITGYDYGYIVTIYDFNDQNPDSCDLSSPKQVCTEQAKMFFKLLTSTMLDKTGEQWYNGLINKNRR